MDADLFVDADCSGDCRSSRAGHSNGNRSRSSVCKNRRSLEWRAFQPEIPGVPVRPRRGIHSVFWCSIFGKSTYWPRLFVDSHPDRFLADIPRRTLSVRRGLRCGSWISLRSAYGTASSPNRRSQVANRKLSWRRGRDSNSRGLSACRFSRPVQSTALPPLPKSIGLHMPLSREKSSLIPEDHTFFQLEQSQPRSFSSRSISDL